MPQMDRARSEEAKGMRFVRKKVGETLICTVAGNRKRDYVMPRDAASPFEILFEAPREVL